MWPGRTPINPQIVHSALLDALDYDCWTGIFIRKIRLGPSIYKNTRDQFGEAM